MKKYELIGFVSLFCLMGLTACSTSSDSVEQNVVVGTAPSIDLITPPSIVENESSSLGELDQVENTEEGSEGTLEEGSEGTLEEGSEGTLEEGSEGNSEEGSEENSEEKTEENSAEDLDELGDSGEIEHLDDSEEKESTEADDGEELVVDVISWATPVQPVPTEEELSEAAANGFELSWKEKYEGYTLVSYTGEATDVDIPYFVGEISRYAFDTEAGGKVTSMVFHGAMQKMRGDAFGYSPLLEMVQVPEDSYARDWILENTELDALLVTIPWDDEVEGTENPLAD